MTPSDAGRRLEELRRTFAGKLPARIDALEAAVHAAATTLSSEDLKAALSHAHRLAGVAGSYGFIEVGEAAAALERELMCDAVDWTAARDALEQVRKQAAAG